MFGQKKWITWKKLKDRWDKVDFELFGFSKEGLQPYSKYKGQTIEWPQSASECENTIFRLNDVERIEKKFSLGPESPESKEVTRLIRNLGEKMGRERREKEEWAKKLPPLWVTAIKAPKNANNVKSEESLVDEESPHTLDHESFIRELRVSYENDSEIKIQLPGKTAVTYNCKNLGFRDGQTKTWKTFISILQEPVKTYNIGPATQTSANIRQRIRSYDANLKILKEIDKKLREFLNNTYSLSLPRDFKLYERCPEEKTGTYRFKFQVGEASTGVTVTNEYENHKKSQLIAEMKDLTERWHKKRKAGREAEASKIGTKIALAAKVAKEKGWLSEDEIREMLEPDTKKEKEVYDPYENVEDRAPDY